MSCCNILLQIYLFTSLTEMRLMIFLPPEGETKKVNSQLQGKKKRQINNLSLRQV